MKNPCLLLLIGLLAFGGTLAAQDPAQETLSAIEAVSEEVVLPDSGDTAWMITATALVLFMTLPGLALFYCGLVRAKNVLTVLVQCFAMASIMTVLWVVYGYSLAFSTAGMYEGVTNFRSFFGGLDLAFLKGVSAASVSGSIPEVVFITFQMTFAIITPALIVGAFAERMKFSAMLIFSIIWFTFSYLPICHMAWSGPGALFVNWDVFDFAGGTVVHVNAGIAGLVACLMIGKRRGFGSEPMPPHSVPFTIVGAGILWVGWFGFNAGSQLAADGTAGMAMLVTQVSTATAAATWMFAEWIRSGKPTAVGIATGAVAGLVAITPASGTAGPMGALLIGFASGLICYLSATSMKRAFGYDDSLDVFGVHGIGGIVGAVLTGLCAAGFMGGSEGEINVVSQMFTQFKSVVVTIVWSGAVSVIALTAAKSLVGLRVAEEVEHSGLDRSEHGEEGYHSA